MKTRVIQTVSSDETSRHLLPIRTSTLIKMLIAKFSKSVSIADIGCGDAFFTMELAKKFCTGAVAHLAQRFRAVIATYRWEHDEKSYWPPMLN